MEKSTTWFKDGCKFETFKDKKNGVARILVKRDGSPEEIIKLNKETMKEVVIKRRR